MLKTSIRLILVTFLLAIVAGCGSPESRMVGKWVGKTGSLEFYKNKTGIINPGKERPELPHNVPFQWSVEEKDRIRMNMALPVGRPVFGKLVSKNVLIVEDDQFVKQ